MITLITGAPGAGKTAALVQLLQQFAKEGRAIFACGSGPAWHGWVSSDGFLCKPASSARRQCSR